MLQEYVAAPDGLPQTVSVAVAVPSQAPQDETGVEEWATCVLPPNPIKIVAETTALPQA